MLNTSHWTNLLQPGGSQVLPAKVYCTPGFSEKKVRQRKPIEVKPKKITTIKQVLDYLESVYPNWVTVDHLLTLPFLEGKEKSAVLTALQHIHDKHPLEARAGVKQAFYEGPLCKEYRLIKRAK